MSSTDISNILKQLDELAQPKQLPALFKPQNISPVLGSPEKKNPMSGYFVGGEGADPDAKPVWYAIRHRDTGHALSSHKDEAAARDEMAGLGDRRQEYKLVKTSRRPNQFGLDEEGSGGQQYAVTIDAIDHGVLSPVTVTASNPAEAKQKAIASATASMAKRGYELQVRSAAVKSAQGVAEGMNDWALKDKPKTKSIPQTSGMNSYAMKGDVHNKAYEYPPTHYDKDGKDMYGRKKPELKSQTEGASEAKVIGHVGDVAGHGKVVQCAKCDTDLRDDHGFALDNGKFICRSGKCSMRQAKNRLAAMAARGEKPRWRKDEDVAEGSHSESDEELENFLDSTKPELDRLYKLAKTSKKAKAAYYELKEKWDAANSKLYGLDEQGVAEGDEPGYVKYEQMKDKISSVLIKLYNQGKDEETIKQMRDRVARHLGYDPTDSIFQDAWMTSFNDASLDGSLNQDSEDDYTDYSMRQGERGNPDRFREQGVAEGSSSPDVYKDRLASIQSLRYDNPQEYAKQYRALLQAMPDEHAAHANQVQKGSYSPGQRGSGTGSTGRVAEGERVMSRAAKGYEKYGKAGMQALAKAGREGKDLDKVRDKYDKYEKKQQGVAEEASPMIAPPSNRFDSKQEAFAHAKKHGGKVFKSTYTDPNTGNKNVSFVVKKDQDVEEGWKQKLGAAALAGSMAMGANARVVPGQDEPGVNRLTGKPNIAQVAAADSVPDSAETEKPSFKGFSTSYLQKAADPNRFGRFLISVENAKAELAAREAAYQKRAQGVDEVAPPGARAERMVKHIKQGYAKDGKLTGKEKAIAYATTWKAHNRGQVEEASADLVGFHLDTERAYNAVMERFGDVVEQDQESGMMTVPRRYWPQLEQVAHDADGIGAIEAGGEKIAVDEVEESYWQPQIDEAIAQEDVLDKEKRHLGDYLQSVADAVKHDAALSSKDTPVHSGDTIGSAVKTVTTDDGHDLKIHGNEDDGFRISIKGRPSRVKFKSLDEAGMACEMYRSHRRHKLESADYIEEQ